jgi:hypothetical protein
MKVVSVKETLFLHTGIDNMIYYIIYREALIFSYTLNFLPSHILEQLDLPHLDCS